MVNQSSPLGPGVSEALSRAAAVEPSIARPAGPRLAVLACQDRRMDVMRILGLSAGEAYVIRNAGGILDDGARRSLAISQHALGVTEIIVMHHTDCGMSRIEDEAFLALLEQRTGARPTWSPGGFAGRSAEEHLRDVLADLAADPFIPDGAGAHGLLYDVATGAIRSIDAIH